MVLTLFNQGREG